MNIIRAYKEGIVSPENQRKFVVPVTGMEARRFLNYCQRVHAPTEMWDGDCAFGKRWRKPTKVAVFRYLPKADDYEIMAHVQQGLGAGAMRDALVPEISQKYFHLARIELSPPNDAHQWGLEAA